MSDLILNGDESTNAHEPDGFLTKIAAPTDPSAEATYADYAGVHATAVDGIHASMETEVGSVIGVASYQHAATVYQAGSGRVRLRSSQAPGHVLHGVELHSGGGEQHPEGEHPARGRSERWRGEPSR